MVLKTDITAYEPVVSHEKFTGRKVYEENEKRNETVVNEYGADDGAVIGTVHRGVCSKPL